LRKTIRRIFMLKRWAVARKYTLLELRARIMLGSAAVDAGDTETAWRDGMATARRFFAGDYPPIRLYARCRVFTRWNARRHGFARPC